MYLVTPTQPFVGLFGDGVASTESAVSDAAIPVKPSTWLIAKASRAAVVVMLLLGVPVYLLTFDAERPWVTKIEAVVARVIVNQSYTSTVAAVNQFRATTHTCVAPTYDGCAQGAATTAVQQLAPTVTLLKNNSFVPADATRDFRNYERYFTALDDELQRVQSSSSAATQYDIIHGQIPKTYANFQRAYRLVKADLTN